MHSQKIFWANYSALDPTARVTPQEFHSVYRISRKPVKPKNLKFERFSFRIVALGCSSTKLSTGN